MKKQGVAIKLAAASLAVVLAGGCLTMDAVYNREAQTVSAAAGDISMYDIFGCKENADGSIGIYYVDFSSAENNTISIPDEIDGKKVTCLRAGMLEAQNTEALSSYSIKLGKNISEIEEYAFDGILVDSISVDSANKYYTVKDNVLYTKDMKTLVYCPSNAKGRIQIPAGPVSIREDAFTSAGLEEIYIGHDIEQLPSNAFSRCTGLLRFTLNSKNKSFSIVKGALLDADQTTMLAYPKGRQADYAMPSSVDTIAPYAFAGSNIATVDLSNVSTVGSYAFEGCDKIKRVKITKNVTDLGEGAFMNCAGLASASFENGVESIPAEIFKNCTSMVTLSVPDSVANIGSGAFDNTGWLDRRSNGFVYTAKVLYCYKTDYESPDGTGDPGVPVKLSIKEGTVSVAQGALRGANVTKLTLPSTLRYIDAEDIYPAYNISEFVVSPDNPYFAARDKFLFTKDLKKLVCAACTYSTASYTVPSTVTEIGSLAFRYNNNIENIYVSENVVKFGRSPFNNGNPDRSVVCMENSPAAAAAKEDDVNRIYLEAGVMLSNTRLSLGVGESYTLHASVTPDIAKRTISWKSSDSSVVEVSDGKLTARKAGKAVITASETSGGKSECTVTVSPAPKSIKMSKTEVTVGVGEIAVLGSILNDGAVSNTRKYTSSDPSVISIATNSWDCRFTAKKAGTATISVATYNGKTASCKVTVKAAPTSVSMTKTQISIGVGETYTIGSAVNSGSASLERTYLSADSDIVAVNPTSWNCSFTGISPGTAVISVKTYNGKTAICRVTVKAPPRFVDMARGVVNIGKGESMTLGSVLLSTEASASRKYRTSNSSIVSMTKTDWTAGFTGKSEGTAYVTVTTYNGQEGSCRVNVKAAPTSITISKSSMTMKVGQTGVLGSTVPEGTAATDIKFRTSNSSIVKMTRTNWQGEFVAVKPGICWVTVRTYNGKESSCKITVTQ